jgi:hypothetical protein
MAVPLSPEQQAQIEAMKAKLGGNPAMSNLVGNTATEAATTANAMTGYGQDAHYQYGGWAGGAHEAANRYAGMANAAQGRTGEVVNTAQSDQTRGQAMSMADLMAKRARGETPSIAQAMADRNMQQAAAEQSSAAASARGPAALALAQQNAALNTSAAQSNISNAAQINAMQERQQAEQAAFSAYGNLRGQDAQSAQFQAQLNAQQRAQNDAFTSAMTGHERGVQGDQLAAQTGEARDQAAGAANYADMVARRKAADDAKTGQALQAGATVFGTAAMMSDMRAKQPAPPGWLTKAQAADPGTSPAAEVPAAPDYSNDVIAASRALDDMQAGKAEPAKPEGHVMQPLAVAGMDALDRRDQEDAGLIAAKQRAGAKLTDKEKRQQPLLARRLGMAQPAALPGARPAPEPYEPSKGQILGQGMMNLGRVFGQPPMYSDDRTKLRAAFMAGVQREMNRDNPAGQPEMPEYMTAGGRKSPEGARYTVEDFKPAPENPNQPLTSSQPFERPDPRPANEEKAIAFSARRADPMPAANRALAASPYTYKPEFAAKTGQAPGEVNVGPMAQTMAQNPVTATAVEKDPQTGMLALDRDKLQKVTAGGVASLQGQVDELRSLMAARLGRGRK